VTVFGDIAPTPQRRQLGRALRRLRKEVAGLSGDELAERISISQSQISRYELGYRVPTDDEIRRWGRATGAPSGEIDELIQLAGPLRAEVLDYRQTVARPLEELQHDVRQLEAATGTLRVFHPVLFPGLLQTGEYIKHLLIAGHGGERPDIPARIAARIERQAVLHDEAKRFEFLVDESVLRRFLGPVSELLDQLRAVVREARRPNVTFGVVLLQPETAVWREHAFTIFDDRTDDGEPLVHLEALTRTVNLFGAEEVAHYLAAFQRLRDVAVLGDDAVALAQDVMAGLLRPGG
jgi:transcriptional regulator with XRE-family HTH domain